MNCSDFKSNKSYTSPCYYRLNRLNGYATGLAGWLEKFREPGKPDVRMSNDLW